MSAVGYYFASTLALSLSGRYDQLLADVVLELGAAELRRRVGVFVPPEDPTYEDTVLQYLQDTGLYDNVRKQAEHRLPQRLPAAVIERYRDVPVGIVDCYIGGTSASAWISEDWLDSSAVGKQYLERFHETCDGKSEAEQAQLFADWQADNLAYCERTDAVRRERPDITPWDLEAEYGCCPWPPPQVPQSAWHVTGPYMNMVSRVAPYSIAGVLWYQGEEDSAYADGYEELLTLLINQWRSTWNSPRLPFMLIQLPQYTAASAADIVELKATGEAVVSRETDESFQWPAIRAAQLAVADELPNVGIVSTMDCGTFGDIHPTDKTTVGIRAAAYALERWYGFAELDGAAADMADDFIEMPGDSGNNATGSLADEMAADLDDLDPTLASVLGVNHDELDDIADMLAPTSPEELAEFRGSNAIVNEAGCPRAREAFATPDGAVLVRFSDAVGLHLAENPTVSGDISETGDFTPLTFSFAERIFGESLMTAYVSTILDPLRSGFELAGADGRWYRACVAIADSSDLDDEAMVRAWLPDSAEESCNVDNETADGIADGAFRPTAIRYAWRDWTAAPLFSEAGNPAFPFLLEL
nr:sialate O-acetylesterase [Bifidobacterium choloepi]